MSTRKAVGVFCAIVVVSMGTAITAERASGGGRTNGKRTPDDRPAPPRVAPVWSQEDELRQTYWAQFGETHVTSVPVEEWLMLLGVEANPVLWTGTLSDVDLSIAWDVASESITATVNGAPLLVEMIQSAGDRPTWRALDYDLAGFVDVDEESASIVLQLDVGEVSHRLHASLRAPDVVAGTFVSPAPGSTCVCFGLGTPSSGCTDKNCDEGVSCGSNNSCRWKSGSCSTE